MEGIKIAISFALGVVVGGVAIYIYQEQRLSKQFEDDLEDYKAKWEAEANDVSYEDNTDKGGNFVKKSRTDIPADAINAAKEMQDGVRKARSAAVRSNNSKVNYNNPNSIEGYSRASDRDSGEHVENLSERLAKNPPIRITEEEFQEELPKGYEILELVYLADENRLIDQNGMVIEDIDTYVGYDMLDDLYEDKVDTVYVCNDNLQCFIEIRSERSLYT